MTIICLGKVDGFIGNKLARPIVRRLSCVAGNWRTAMVLWLVGTASFVLNLALARTPLLWSTVIAAVLVLNFCWVYWRLYRPMEKYLRELIDSVSAGSIALDQGFVRTLRLVVDYRLWLVCMALGLEALPPYDLVEKVLNLTGYLSYALALYALTCWHPAVKSKSVASYIPLLASMRRRLAVTDRAIGR